MFFRRFIISTWRFFKRCQWEKKCIKIDSSAHFDRNTILEGYNVIGAGSWISGACIGRNTYLGNNCSLPNAKIGRFCSLSTDISVVTNTHPSKQFVSTNPIFYSCLGQCGQSFTNKNLFSEFLSINGQSVIIGNDVWIGHHVIIKGGITIGDGAIIAMGAIVTKDVPPYAIVGGTPAKTIRFRFSETQIQFLQTINWWNQSDEWIKMNIDLFVDIDLFVSRLKQTI